MPCHHGNEAAFPLPLLLLHTTAPSRCPNLLKPFPVGWDIPEASAPASSSCSEGRVGVWEAVTFPVGSDPSHGGTVGSFHDPHSGYSTPESRQTNSTSAHSQLSRGFPGSSSSLAGMIPMGTPPARGSAAAGWAVRDAAVEFQEDGAGLAALVRSPSGSPALLAPPSHSSDSPHGFLPSQRPCGQGYRAEPGTEAPHPFLHSNLMQREREKGRRCCQASPSETLEWLAAKSPQNHECSSYSSASRSCLGIWEKANPLCI